MCSVQRARVCSRYYLGTTSCPCTPPTRRASSVSRRLHPRHPTSTSTVTSLRQTYKNWSKTSSKESSPYDVSVARITSILNIDLPQTFQKLLPQSSSTKRHDSQGVNKPEDNVTKRQPRYHAIHQRALLDNTSKTDASKETALITKSILEEQTEPHDLEQAIIQTNVVIKDYHKEAFVKNAESTEESKPFTKPPDVIRKEMHQSMLQQLSHLLPTVITGRQVPPSKEAVLKRVMAPKRSIDSKTRGLVEALRAAKSNESRLVRLQELCRHLQEYQEAKNLAVREKVVGVLLRLRHVNDIEVKALAMEALTLVGWVDPVQGRGVRVLSLDGGGTRGLVCLEILKCLEASTGKAIHEQFDFVCGVSTGALIGLMVGVFRIPLVQAEEIYKEFSREMFRRNRVMGASGLITSHAYYDTELWENILKENVGYKTFLQTSKDPNNCKVASISALMNYEKIQNYLFRNYTYPPGQQSHYPGSMEHRLWESIRASSAAPGYYEEFKLEDNVHQDGGLLTNNPSAIALHECRLLWPSESIHSMVSVGTGRYEPTDAPQQSSVGLRSKLTKIVQSATDTEAVHTVLNDLLPHSSYFRFNPYMSEEFTLDETREEKWDQMQLDARMYCRKNEQKILNLAQRLNMNRKPHQKAQDYVKQKMAVIG